jgi:hypothetical protein
MVPAIAPRRSTRTFGSTPTTTSPRPTALAQCIDGASLALTLTRLRGKLAPGVDELRDAATACFGQGSALAIEDALREVLVGEAVGRVSQKVGRTPLQSEFYATVNRLGLPVVDASTRRASSWST